MKKTYNLYLPAAAMMCLAQSAQSAEMKMTMIEAVDRGLVPKVIKFIEADNAIANRRCKNVNKRDADSSETSLHVAVRESRYSENGKEILRLLVAAPGIWLNAGDWKGWRPLHEAVWMQNEFAIHLLLGNPQTKIAAGDSHGDTPFHLAAELGYVREMEALLQHQQPPMVLAGLKNKRGWTPLHEAVIGAVCCPLEMPRRFAEIVELLHNHGAKMDEEDQCGQSPLDIAVMHRNFDAVRILINNGASVKQKHWQYAVRVRDKNSMGVFIDALANSFNGNHYRTLAIEMMDADSVEMVEFFIYKVKRSRINIDNIIKREGILLLFAIDQGAKNVFNFLIEQKDADINLISAQGGFTPLYVAASRNRADMLEILLEQDGIDVNKPSLFRKYTPLHIAAGLRNNKEAAEILIRQKTIDVNRKDDMGRTPLHIAADIGADYTVSLLLGEKNIAVNAQDNFGDTPMHTAIKCAELVPASLAVQNFEVMKLLAGNEKVNLNHPNNDNETPLHLLAIMINLHRTDTVKVEGALEIMKLLIRKGVKTNLKNRRGWTAIQILPPEFQAEIEEYAKEVQSGQWMCNIC